MALEQFVNASANSFSFTIDGVQMPLVMEVSGLKMEVDKIESKQQVSADGKYVVQQIPGLMKASEFTVTRGLTDSKTIVDWLKTVMQGDIAGARKTAAVNILDHQGAVIKTYNFRNCWVRSVEVNSLKAGATEQATEKATICFDEASVA
jgi:phage tail-like protein